jgi:hypothetical protein
VVLSRVLFSLLLAFATLLAPVELWAKPATRLDVTEVVLARKQPNHEKREKEVGREVRRAAQRSSKSLDFGGMKRLELSFEVVELDVQTTDELVRVSCTIVGRLRGGGTARSHLSFGGKPSRRTALERQVIGMVTEGVVTRLAEMSRQRSQAQPPAP